jgi:hypothetical protein
MVKFTILWLIVVWIAVGGTRIYGGTWSNETGKYVLKAEILFKRVFWNSYSLLFVFNRRDSYKCVLLMLHLGSVICNSVKCNSAHKLACRMCVHMALPPK